ncbi:lytic transglycosylase domain-containing protein [Planomonospora sp. ID67723]|uniref:aggregation-promoting factor C-terminal-like domain-containing protein n=1 Tax=Planomonospora sp. ID67723 TaxID=2738134 RepID=UPI0018C3C21F|nr:lytic transglycosylase domain-containing protein [Planomonospora sp. ID67723]MBG0830981.1 lytic transglycosylase domain-containing protein [Planomonospora sp. ID67723]
MNGNRALRTTVVTALTACTVATSTAACQAEAISMPVGEEPAETVHRGERSAQAAHPGEWSAQAAHRSGQSTGTVHRGVWSTEAEPQDRPRARTAKGRNKAIAFRLVSRRAWSDDQFRCLDRLWTRESNWNHRAHNRYTGAYGIPQALPGSKMSGSGGDWRSNPATQINWGLRYIKGRYGSPCGAWGHFQARNWY